MALVTVTDSAVLTHHQVSYNFHQQHQHNTRCMVQLLWSVDVGAHISRDLISHSTVLQEFPKRCGMQVPKSYDFNFEIGIGS